MHNCEIAHPKKSHRRRNRALRRALEPLRWFDDPRAASGEWGLGARRRIETMQPAVAAVAISTDRSGSMLERECDRRVEVYQPSALRRWAADLRRFMRWPTRDQRV